MIFIRVNIVSYIWGDAAPSPRRTRVVETTNVTAARPSRKIGVTAASALIGRVIYLYRYPPCLFTGTRYRVCLGGWL